MTTTITITYHQGQNHNIHYHYHHFYHNNHQRKTGTTITKRRLPTSASSLRPLRSLDRRELFVSRTRTTMAKSRSFSVAGPSLWNRLPPSARASFLSSNLSTSLQLLKTCLFSWS